MGTKKWVDNVEKSCQIMIGGMPKIVNVNLLPLGSYDVLVNTHWLAGQKTKIDCFNKSIEPHRQRGKVKLQGKVNPIIVMLGLPFDTYNSLINLSF